MAQNRFGTRIEEPIAPETKSPEERRLPDQRSRAPQREPALDRAPTAKSQRFAWRPKAIYQLLRATYAEWSRDKVPRMGAALAYYTIFSLAPLLVIAIAIAGFVFAQKPVRGESPTKFRDLFAPNTPLPAQP